MLCFKLKEKQVTECDGKASVCEATEMMDLLLKAAQPNSV